MVHAHGHMDIHMHTDAHTDAQTSCAMITMPYITHVNLIII